MEVPFVAIHIFRFADLKSFQKINLKGLVGMGKKGATVARHTLFLNSGCFFYTLDHVVPKNSMISHKGWSKSNQSSKQSKNLANRFVITLIKQPIVAA